jgi:hypothetical protein
MRTILLAAALALASAASTGCGKKQDAAGQHDLKEMSVDEVAAGLEAKQLTAVDCNGEGTRKRHGILPGAILVEDSESYAATELPADKATKLVFYCGGPG